MTLGKKLLMLRKSRGHVAGAAGGDADVEPVSAPVRKERNIKIIAGARMAAFGALGWFAVYVVSRFVEVMIPYTYRDEFGEVWTTMDSSRMDVNFGLFVEEYHLKGLLAGMAVLFAAGIVLIFWDKYIGPRIKRER